MAGDESSPCQAMHFREEPSEDPDHPLGGDLHSLAHVHHHHHHHQPHHHHHGGNEDGDSSPTSVRFGRLKAYPYHTQGFPDPLEEPPYQEDRRFRSPSGNEIVSDYIRTQYSPPASGDWIGNGGNMAGAGNTLQHPIPPTYIEMAQHSPRAGLMVSWPEQQKFNARGWVETEPPVGGGNGAVVSSPPASGSSRRGGRGHNNNSGGSSTTTSTSSLNESIPDDTLAHLTVKELNKRVQNLNREDVVALKQRRRTLKNRGYAMNCRLRRQQHKETLEVQVNALKKDNIQLRNERDYYKSQWKNCRCQVSGNEPLDISSSSSTAVVAGGAYHHHHHIVTAHQQLDLSVNAVTTSSPHEDFKRVYSGGTQDIKVQPNMNSEDYKKQLDLSNFSTGGTGLGTSGRDHLDIKILANEIEPHKM